MQHQLKYRFLLCCFLSGVIYAQAGPVKICGHILDRDGRTGLENVGIVVTGERYGCASDSGGYFELWLPRGEWILQFSRLGYAPLMKQIDLRTGAEIELTLMLQPVVYPLEPVVITRSEGENHIFSHHISAAALRKLPAFAEPDPQRAVQVLPGLSSASDFSSQLFIRGSAPDQTAVLFDGVPVFNPYHLGGVFGLFNVDGVGAVQFSPGINTVNESGRLGGRLNVVPVVPDEGNTAMRLSLGLLSSRGYLETPLGRGSLYLAVRRTYFDLVNRIVSRDPSPYHFYDMQGGLAYRLGSKQRIQFNILFTRDALTNILEKDEGGLTGLTQPVWGNRIASLRWQWQLSTHAGLETQLAYSDSHTRSQTTRIHVDNLEGGIFIRQELLLKPRKGEATLIGWEAGQTLYRYGWSIQDARNLENIVQPPESVFFDGAPADYQFPETVTNHTGVYISHNRQYRKWHPEVGLHGKWYSETNQFLWLPRLRIGYHLGRKYLLSAGYAKGAQFEYQLKRLDNNEVFAPFAINFPVRKPWAPLIVHEATVGLRYEASENSQLLLESYYKALRQIPEIDPDRQMQVVRDGEVLGADIMLILRPGVRLSFSAAYSYTHTRFSNGAQHYPAVFERRHALKGLSVVSLSPSWRITAFWTFQGGLPFTPVIGQRRGGGSTVDPGSPVRIDPFSPNFPLDGVAAVYGTPNSLRFPVYHRLDVAVSKSWKPAYGEWTLTLQILNIYNRGNVLFTDWKTSYGGATGERVNNFPILPTINVTLML